MFSRILIFREKLPQSLKIDPSMFARSSMDHVRCIRCVFLSNNVRTHTHVEQVYPVLEHLIFLDAVLLWQIAPAFQSHSAQSRVRIAEPLVVRREMIRGKERRVGERERVRRRKRGREGERE